MDAAVPWRVRDAALLLVFGGAALLLIALGAQGLYRLQGAPGLVPAQPPTALTIMAIDLFYLTVLAGVWLLVVRRYGTPWSSLGLRWPGSTDLPAVFALSALLAAGCAVTVASVVWALNAAGLQARFTPVTAVPAPSDPLFVVAVIGSVVLTPIVEEMLFRGVLYQALRKHMGAVLGAASSAALFAALHLQFNATPALLVLGIALTIAFERTRSLYPPMLLHAAYNGVVILLALHLL